MVLKFSFANEIHRCSEFPSHFNQLGAFLASTFKATLPAKYQLKYVDPSTESQRLISSQQDYEEVLKLDSSKPIKIIIQDLAGLISDYDYIGENKNLNSQGVVEDKFPGLEKIVENMSESVIVPQANKQLSYFSIVPSQDENIRQIVKDVVREQLPFIISQVKDAVLQELRAFQPAYPVVPQPEKDVMIKQAQAEEKKAQNVEKVHFYKSEEPEDFYKPEYIKPVEHEFVQSKHDNHYEEEVELQPAGEEKGNAFFAKIKDIGKAIKGQVVELPGKAINVLEDWSNKIEGDPYVVIEEGRYPKSVVDKANGLKEVFVEEPMKTLLDFVNRYPRTANLEQLAHAFLFKDQDQGQGLQNNEPEHLDQPVDGNAGINGGNPENKEFWV